MAGETASPPTARTYLEIFAALIRDRRVSHGAFRLWHALRDYTNANSTCFPGQRRLADDIGCDPHSLRRWTEELMAAKWLTVDREKAGLGFTYTVMDGAGQPLRKSTTPTVAQNHITSVAEKRMTSDGKNHSRGVVEKHNEPLRKTATKVSSPVKSAQLSQSNNFVPE